LIFKYEPITIYSIQLPSPPIYSKIYFYPCTEAIEQPKPKNEPFI